MCPPKPKVQQIAATPPPPAPAAQAASTNQTGPQSPDKQTDIQTARRSGAASLRIPLKRQAKSVGVNIPK